jgi:hypothetical protein
MAPTSDEETIPILRISDREAAIEWYGRLGFVEPHRAGVHVAHHPHLSQR